jgi:hypothetical protein
MNLKDDKSEGVDFLTKEDSPLTKEDSFLTKEDSLVRLMSSSDHFPLIKGKILGNENNWNGLEWKDCCN